jgi:hypothetical protein
MVQVATLEDIEQYDPKVETIRVTTAIQTGKYRAAPKKAAPKRANPAKKGCEEGGAKESRGAQEGCTEEGCEGRSMTSIVSVKINDGISVGG